MLHDFDSCVPRGSVDLVDRRERRCAARNAVELDRAEAEVEHGVGAVVTDYDRGRIKPRCGIDINFTAISKAKIGVLVVAEVGGRVVAEMVRMGARATCQYIVAETAVKHVGAITAVQLVV